MRIFIRRESGGVARASLNHRLMAENPPGLLMAFSLPWAIACSRVSLPYRSHFQEVFVHAGGGHPGGMPAVSRGLSAAISPESIRETNPIPEGSQPVAKSCRRIRPALPSLRDAAILFIPTRWCRRVAPRPPANGFQASGLSGAGHPGGMPAIGRGLSGATPPDNVPANNPIPKGSQGFPDHRPPRAGPHLLASLRDAGFHSPAIRWCRSGLAQPPANGWKPSGFAHGFLPSLGSCLMARSKSDSKSRSCTTRYFSNSLSAKALAISAVTLPG